MSTTSGLINSIEEECFLEAKARHPGIFSPHVKKAVTIQAEQHGSVADLLDFDTASAILTYAGSESSYMPDIQLAIREVRRFEKENLRPIFLVLSLVNVSDYTSEWFVDVCKLVYMNGVDAILVRGALSLDPFRFIREKALGLRGRRVKILLDGVSRISEVVGAVDGVVVSTSIDCASQLGTDLLSKQKMVWVRDPGMTDSVKADVVIWPYWESSTPPTTVPSSPVASSTCLRPTFLFRELMKFVSVSTRLVIALSDDGLSAWELTIQARKNGIHIPLILGLSASESTCRFMGCLYGVIPMQTQSFISINAVFNNAICYAKDKGLLALGEEVVLVTQPPPVTSSTNESCFEGLVQRRVIAA